MCQKLLEARGVVALVFFKQVKYIENNTLCFHDMKNLSRRLG